MNKLGDKWVIVQHIQGSEKVVFTADTFEEAWDAWVSYQK